jgi:hypothetical protein
VIDFCEQDLRSVAGAREIGGPQPHPLFETCVERSDLVASGSDLARVTQDCDEDAADH